MPLSSEINAILIQDLKDPFYNGMTSSLAYATLFYQATINQVVPNGQKINAVLCSKAIGAAKTQLLMVALKSPSGFPDIANFLIEEGLDYSDPGTVAFLNAQVQAGSINSADIAALNSYCTQTVSTHAPGAAISRFSAQALIALRSAAGLTAQQSEGFPNLISMSDFQAAWVAAGRS